MVGPQISRQKALLAGESGAPEASHLLLSPVQTAASAFDSPNTQPRTATRLLLDASQIPLSSMPASAQLFLPLLILALHCCCDPGTKYMTRGVNARDRGRLKTATKFREQKGSGGRKGLRDKTLGSSGSLPRERSCN